MDEPADQILSSLKPLIRPGRIVMIGEWHGTNQFPQLVERIVAKAMAQQLGVIVGLEVPCSEQPVLDRLAYEQSTRAHGVWWQRADEFQDGRSSTAMANLVGVLTSLEPVTVVAMDGPWVAPGSAVAMEYLHLLEAPRDETMARHLLDAMDRNRKAFTVVLAGPEHVTVGTDHAGRPTLGRYISQWHPQAVALLGRSSGGQAWGLRADEQSPESSEIAELDAGFTPGPHAVPDDAELSPGAQWADRVGPDGFHGYVHVGPVTASPPAASSATYRGEAT